MKRIISALMALCLLMACCPALADEVASASLGRPYANPNLYTVFPAERPGPEENYYFYVNYDRFVDVSAGRTPYLNDQFTHAKHLLGSAVTDISLNMEYTDTDSQIVRLLYGLVTNTEKRDRDGLAPLMSRVDRLRAVKNTEEMTALLLEDGFLISVPFLRCHIQPASMDPKLIVVAVSKDTLLEPQYPEDGGIMTWDTEKARRMLLNLRCSKEEADRLLAEIVRYAEDWVGDEVPDWLPLDGSPISLKDIRENCPLLFMLLNAVGMVKEGAETQPMYEVEYSSLLSFLSWYTDENLETLKAMAALCLYKDATAALDTETYRESALYIRNQTEEEAAFAVIKHLTEIPMNQAYVTHYCPEETWRTATNMFEETREAMRRRISANSWMSAETKQRAMAKLDDLSMGQIVPPGGNFDCGPLLADLQGCDTLMDAAAKCIRFNNRCMMRFAGETIIRENPYTLGDSSLGVLGIGGQYLPDRNMFFISALALSDALCDYTSRETLLATLGWHIGHELCHGYDFLGARYNADRTGPLFTDEDNAVFTEKSMAIADTLSQIESGNGVMLQGRVLVIEAMADMTGMTLMLDLAKQEENFDYDVFFRAFAVFCFDYSPGDDDRPEGNGFVNPHPPYHVRVNFTLAHFDEFYETNPTVTEGTPVYIAPEDRVLVY